MSDALPVVVFCDGSCLGNPGPGGWAALLRTPKGELLLKGGDPDTTNNRMELMGAIAALEHIPEGSKVHVTTDSNYVRQGIETWVKSWQRKGWRTSGGGPVKNQDLWQRLVAATARHQVAWAWVKGHSGHPDNERVDEAARGEAEALRSAAPMRRSGR